MSFKRRSAFASIVVLVLVLVPVLAGCGSDAPLTPPAADAGPGTDLGPPAVDAGPPPPALVTIASSAWTLGAGVEKYLCVLVTTPDEIFVSEFHPVIPLGTHHTVLTFAPPGAGADRTEDCDGFTVGPRMIYGSGVGTDPLVFPEGVAVRIPAGSQLLLNLHLVNFDTTLISGTSAIQVRTVDAAAVVNEAEISLAGKDAGLIVAARTVSTQTGTCNVPADTTLFAIFPHMHQTAVHQKVTLLRGSDAPVIVMDDDYTFDEQYYRLLAPGVQLLAGDQLEVECTYDNPGDAMGFGESTTDEMCYAGIYVYQAGSFFTTCSF